MKKIIGLAAILVLGSVLFSCKDKDPSIAKIFVRNFNLQLISDAKVIIIADVDSDPATPDHVDTLTTNSSGFVSFDLDGLFDTYGKKDEKVAYFDILVKYEDKEEWSEMRARAHMTSVTTVTLPQ